MAFAAVPAVAAGARATAGKTAAKKSATRRAGRRLSDVPEMPGGGGSRRDRPWRDPARTRVKGAPGHYQRWLIAEFIICVMLLGLSPLAKEPGEMGPRRFMKRGSATCGFFVVLGLVSAAGRGAAKAAAMFGALVTLVLLVDQREAFGALANTLNTTKADERADAAAFAETLGPDDSTDADDTGPGVMAV